MLQYTMLGDVATKGTWSEGVCKDGNQVVCRMSGSEYVCVACNWVQLDRIKTLQAAINVCAKVLGLGAIKVDGQVGYRTSTAVGQVGYALQLDQRTSGFSHPVIALAYGSPKLQSTIRTVAMATPELLDYFTRAATELGKTVVPIVTPIPKTPDGMPMPAPPGTTPGPGDFSTVYAPSKRAKYIKAAFGVFAVLTTVGLVATAIYYEKYARRGV